ncbi:MAG: methyltransferase domain-containing protein [Acidobacteria bacterium]|nr:methyltransferase domain-containing protein [Acidobacteriota bacterium]
MDVETVVSERYSACARAPEPALCCAPGYDPKLLDAVPPEVVERDFGCGDPTPFVRPGDTVLDLGSGAGKLCYLAAQLAGPEGRVIGVDMNDEMLAVARRNLPRFTERTGLRNLEFRKARIQDLRLDLERVDRALREQPVRNLADLAGLEARRAAWAREEPAVPDGSIDCIVSNCVLNLVRKEDREALFREMHRVLRVGGLAAISDVVSDEPVPGDLQRDPALWSGCVSGAFQEEEFLDAFHRAGFYGVEIVSLGTEPYRVVGGIEFRSLTVTARKGKEGPCIDRRHAVIYRGPWSAVEDDDGHRLERGARVAVCEKTFRILGRAPYADSLILVAPREGSGPIPPRPFDCATPHRRDPRETKGMEVRSAGAAGSCAPDGDGRPAGSCC